MCIIDVSAAAIQKNIVNIHLASYDSSLKNFGLLQIYFEYNNNNNKLYKKNKGVLSTILIQYFAVLGSLSLITFTLQQRSRLKCSLCDLPFNFLTRLVVSMLDWQLRMFNSIPAVGKDLSLQFYLYVRTDVRAHIHRVRNL